MKRCKYDVVIIGGGPAGLAAAIAARREGAESVAVFERDFRAGGILEQCIHIGFGLHRFKEDLSGPEYATRFISEAKSEGVDIFLSTTIISINKDTNILEGVNQEGNLVIDAGAIVLAMGCRERTRHQIVIPGTRPAGIFTAGTAQRFINVQNAKVGKNIVILGSGDVGMIMARRLSLEGANVCAVIEINPYLTGLTRNRVQCLDDYSIPLYLSHTITNIYGSKRVESVEVCQVDEQLKPIPGSELLIECDTVLCSVGLIPENELSREAGIMLDNVTGGPVVDSTLMTSRNGVFACGNVLHINDLVDNVSDESEIAGRAAARYVKGNRRTIFSCKITAGNGVSYTMPGSINLQEDDESIRVFFRVSTPMRNVKIVVNDEKKCLLSKNRDWVNPGEMESVLISREKLIGCSNITISMVRNDSRKETGE